ncbi:unnamed protein product, partial [Sphacelaria rigidula]
PLQKALHRSISRRSPDIAASLTQIPDGFLAEMDPDRAEGKTGPVLLSDLERRLIGYFDKSYQASAIQKLSIFVVASDVPLGDYLREFKLLVSGTTGVGRQNGPSDAICQTYVRNGV